eukprot:CAMPEP_0183746442 /NCGR_PEP_ID=MMETSP0737-20130205/66752_1 /TAXON_ID=385413 /ORGANISM="Thalassiosira miniscula, Strain CCMP1093" /LENGTH=713 /DNA_ID=CAMNT_0025982137 /DNA_START=170 /DNA_END=2309 /DNA_ORIENTATION=-
MKLFSAAGILLVSLASTTTAADTIAKSSSSHTNDKSLPTSVAGLRALEKRATDTSSASASEGKEHQKQQRDLGLFDDLSGIKDWNLSNLLDGDGDGDWEFGGLSDVVDSVASKNDWDLGELPDIMDSFISDNNWNFGDGPDANADSGVNLGFGGTETASGTSNWGGLMGNFDLDCPGTCTKRELCTSSDPMLSKDRKINNALEEACDLGCLPVMSSCDDVCGNIGESKFLGSLVDMACDSCKFLQCCAGEDSSGFETCQNFLPEMYDFVSEIDWDWDMTHHTEWNFTEWGTGVDWDGIEVAWGHSELVEGIHTLLDEALADFDFSFPVSCNNDTCPIDGVCDKSIDFANFDVEDLCVKNAFFDCAEGLEKMCADVCEVGSDHFLHVSFCSLCGIAECCRDKDDETSFEDCTREALPEDIVDVIDNIDFDEISTFSFEDCTREALPEDIVDVIDNIDFDEISTFIEDIVGDVTIPEFCPEVDGVTACPVEGFCDIFSGETTNFDLSSINYDEVCSGNAIFSCGPKGFESMCTDKCNPGSDGLLNVAFCSICDVAICCRDKGNATSFEDCTREAVPEEIADAVESITQAVDELAQEVSGEPAEDVEDSVAEPADESTEEPTDVVVKPLDSSTEDPVVEEQSGFIAGAPVEVSIEGSSGNLESTTEESDPEPLLTPDTPAAAAEILTEVSRSSASDPDFLNSGLDSGSQISQSSVW